MRSDAITKGVACAPQRSLLHALGMTDEEMQKPMIGIVSSYNEIVPGHMNIDKIVNAVKTGVAMAGGNPIVFPAIAVCDGIAMGHQGMKYSLVTRDLIADSTESMALAHAFDALVMVPNCDKNVPGLLMAAARLNIPCIFVSGGPMLAGRFAGHKTSLSSMFEAVGSYNSGKLTAEELNEYENKACPSCGSLQVGYNGFGTEKIEEDIKRLFPSLKTLRLDSDTASDKGRTKEVLDSFAKGEADILLGTQMVAKGFNFPKVSLVGIILADTTLQMPDFRSAERTFSLLTQVSGRAGRFSAGGKVIIQTYRPGNYAIACAAALDEKSFYRSELQSRQLLGFPPFSRLFRFVFRSKNQEKALSSASDFARMLTRMQPTGFRFQMLGPAECPLAVISDNYRYQIIINTDKFASAHGVLSAALASYKVPSGVYVEADVDPLSLM